MITTTEAFDEFDENLKLDPGERADAEALHNAITSLLIERSVARSAFLQGSFARKTMISPLRDVDKVIVLHESLAGKSPEHVMDVIEQVVASVYPDVVFDRSRHAIKVDFGPLSFHFDSVPAWETETDDDDVLIANRDSGDWGRSNTRELIREVRNRNAQTGGRFIHQVRMAKRAVKQLTPEGCIPGLHVESWAYMAIQSPKEHDDALAATLAEAAGLLGRTYTEPTGVDEISSRLKPDVIELCKPRLERAASRAREARRLTLAGDHVEAVRIWGELCGSDFPQAPAQDDRQALARAFQGGSVTSAGAVSPTAAGARALKPSRSWRRAL